MLFSAAVDHAREFYLQPEQGQTKFVFQDGVYNAPTAEKRNQLYDEHIRNAWVVKAVWVHFDPKRGPMQADRSKIEPDETVTTATVLRPNYITNGSRNPNAGNGDSDTIVYPIPAERKISAALSNNVVEASLFALVGMCLFLSSGL